MKYITVSELKSYLQIKGDYADGKLTPIVGAVNKEVADYTGNQENTATLKLKAFRYAEYLYLKTAGVESEKDVDVSRKYGSEELGVEDFIPDKFSDEENEANNTMEVDII